MSFLLPPSEDVRNHSLWSFTNRFTLFFPPEQADCFLFLRPASVTLLSSDLPTLSSSFSLLPHSWFLLQPACSPVSLLALLSCLLTWLHVWASCRDLLRSLILSLSCSIAALPLLSPNHPLVSTATLSSLLPSLAPGASILDLLHLLVHRLH